MTSDRAASAARSRRRYSAELQAQVMAECNAPSASVAKVAMSHGINANVAHRWRQLARESRPALATSAGAFVPVTLPAMLRSTDLRDIQL